MMVAALLSPRWLLPFGVGSSLEATYMASEKGHEQRALWLRRSVAERRVRMEAARLCLLRMRSDERAGAEEWASSRRLVGRGHDV